MNVEEFNIDRDGVTGENGDSFTVQLTANVTNGKAMTAMPNPTGNLGYYTDIDSSFSGFPNSMTRYQMYESLLPTAKSVTFSLENHVKDIATCEVRGLENAVMTNDGSNVYPSFEVYYNGYKLEEGTDYLASFDTHSKVRDLWDVGTLYFEGIGVFEGTSSLNYTVHYDLATCTFALDKTSYAYTGKVIDPDYIINDGAYRLIKDMEYTVSYYTDKARTKSATPKNAGKYYVTIEGGYDYAGKVDLPTPIEITKVTPKMSLDKRTFTYNGSYQKPKVTTNSDGKIVLPKSKLPGTYTATVGTGTNHTKRQMTYKIVVKPTTIKSLTATIKGFNVTATKQSSTYITGYQVRYSTSSKMTKATTLTIGTKNTAVTKKITKLAGGKKYYVQVRTYKKIGTKKYYSAWSATKSVTTKR